MSDFEFTHVEENLSKPDSYKNINSSCSTSPYKPNDTNNFSYVVMYNNKPQIILPSLDEASRLIRTHIENVYNSLLSSYSTDTYSSIRIIITSDGYEIIEYNPFIPFYDNVLLSLSIHKVKQFKN